MGDISPSFRRCLSLDSEHISDLPLEALLLPGHLSQALSLSHQLRLGPGQGIRVDKWERRDWHPHPKPMEWEIGFLQRKGFYSFYKEGRIL